MVRLAQTDGRRTDLQKKGNRLRELLQIKSHDSIGELLVDNKLMPETCFNILEFKIPRQFSVVFQYGFAIHTRRLQLCCLCHRVC